MTGLAPASLSLLAPHLPKPTMVAGYSVGDLAAFSAAELFGADHALHLAHRRAALMDACVGPAPGRLLAVSGARVQSLDALLSP